MKKNWLIAVVVIALIVVCAIMTRPPSETGSIKVAATGGTIQLEAASAFGGSVEVTHAQGKIPVTIGTYVPSGIMLAAQKDGVTWKMSSFGPWGDLETIEVEQGNTRELTFGPPFTINADVGGGGRMKSIGFNIIGLAGEHYSPVVYKGVETAPAPKLKIVDEKGQELASGQFEYG